MMDKWEKVFEYTDGDNVLSGSKKVEGDEIHVSYQNKYQGKEVHGVSATRTNDDAVKQFFYQILRDRLGGSRLIMRTVTEQVAEPYHDRMKEIEQQILPAIVAKYEEILGPLEDITKDKMDAAAAELKVICDGWYK